MFRLLTLSLALVAFPALALAPNNFPPPTDYLVDQAHLFDASSTAHLKAICSQLDKAGIAQIAVVTIPDLGDDSIEDYSADLFRKWGIGHDKKRKDGLLILFVPGLPGHRKVRIEVGYGLEGVLPDGKVGQIRTEQAFPYMKENNYGAAAVHVVDAIAALLQADAAAGGDSAPTANSPRGGPGVAAPGYPSAGGIAAALLAMLALVITLIVTASRRQFPGAKAKIGAGLFSGVAALAWISGGGFGAFLVLIIGLIVSAVIWVSIRSHKCPKDGSWMTIDEVVVDEPTYWSQGLAHVTERCTNQPCGYHREYDKTLPRRQRTAYVGGGGGGGGGSSSGGGGDGFSGFGGGDSGGGGASGEV